MVITNVLNLRSFSAIKFTIITINDPFVVKAI